MQLMLDYEVRSRRSDHWEPEERRGGDVSTTQVQTSTGPVSLKNASFSVADGRVAGLGRAPASVPRRLADVVAHAHALNRLALAPARAVGIADPQTRSLDH